MIGQMPGGPTSVLRVYVEESGDVIDRAIATLIAAVEMKDGGNRRGGVRDLGGPLWFFVRVALIYRARLSEWS